MVKKEHCSGLCVGQARTRLALDFFQNKAMDMSIRYEVVRRLSKREISEG
jgi:hypothetical protein